jgi:hypothetical protein
MATIAELLEWGQIFKLDPELEDDEQELRLIYTSPQLRTWFENDLPNVPSFFDTETDPLEDLVALVATYSSGLPLVFDRQFKAFHKRPLESIGDGVWYLKTPDLRIFGWFFARDCFIGVVANTFEMVKKHNLYQGHRGDVIRFRNALPLDEPKFIPGDNPDDVISNYDLPD